MFLKPFLFYATVNTGAQVMIYKTFGNTSVKVSALGFGAMCLPIKEVDG